VTDQYPPPASVPPPDPTGNPAPPPPPFQPPAYGPPPTYPPQADPYAAPVDPQQAYAQQAYPPPGYQQPPGYPPPPGYPQTPYGYPGYPQADPGVNGFAIASLACGFFGIIGAVLATVFGIIALNQIGKRGQRGRGLAIAGLSLAAVWVVVLIAGIAIVVAQGDTSSASKTPADTVVPTVVQSTPTAEPNRPRSSRARACCGWPSTSTSAAIWPSRGPTPWSGPRSGPGDRRSNWAATR